MQETNSKFVTMANTMRAFTVLLMVFSVVGMLQPLWAPVSIGLSSSDLGFQQIPESKRWVSLLVWNFGSLLWLFALLQMERLFHLQAQGEIFTKATIQRITIFGICLLLEPIIEAISFAWLEYYVGQTASILTELTEYWLYLLEEMFIGLLILFMAVLLESGRKLSQEVELTI